jgi:hypothetical protein
MKRDNAIESAINYIDSQQLPIEESRSSQKIDYLLRLGLAKEQGKLNLYKRVLANPVDGVNNQITRKYTAEILNTLLDVFFNDTVIWNRFKTILTRNRSKSLKSLREDISEDGMRALIKKSNEYEIPLDTIFEVYSRGAELGDESDGFNRVNSFIAGGRARKLDADLLGETVIVEPQPKDNTLSVVKRILESRRS